MKNLILIIVSLTAGKFLNAQVFERTRFSYEIENGLANEEYGASAAATMYSLIGDYLNSSFLSDLDISWGIDTVDISDFTLESAYKNILDAASGHKLIIISEAHLKPQHRVFAKQIILGLRKQGFEYLGMETFTSINNSNDLFDTLIHERGYPLNSQMTGGYTLEPKMGDLVRESLMSGYRLFAYENSTRIEGKDRDQIQAENVIKFLNKIGDKKVVLLCGYHHVIEGGTKKRGAQKWMANIIKDSLGIDPLTIYQDNFTEKFIFNEHKLLNERNIEEVSVLLNNLGSIVKLSEEVDIEVIHPKTEFINGRPNWLFEDETYQEIDIPLDSMTLDFPIIVSAYFENEYDKGVPMDRVECKSKYVNRPLILRPGQYIVELKNSEEKKTYKIIVKK